MAKIRGLLYFFAIYLFLIETFFEELPNLSIFQPASSADIWRWVHSVYGDELGLTSEDENDYVSPYVTPEGKVALKHRT